MSGDKTIAPPSSAPDLRAKLRGIVDAFPGQGFAIVDGGHFDDLPALFKKTGLFARSLFLDKADAGVRAAGPWLVKLSQEPEATDKVFELVGDKPAVVFWCCEDGEMVLWRHLRGLNMARIPPWAAEGLVAAPSGAATAETYETVMFRHWDPSVLGSLLPALDAAQFSRILGPANELVFFAKDHGGVRRVVADRSWPPAPPGLLTIRASQIHVLTERRLSASHRRIMTYLRDVAPDHTTGVSDDDLLYQVQYSERVGQDLGLTTERAHAQWAFLMVTSKGAVANQETVTRFIATSDRSPDHQVDEAMRHVVAAARQRDGAH